MLCWPAVGTTLAPSAVRRLESTDQHQGRGRDCVSTRRQSLTGVLAGSLLLVALVPFLPLAILTWSGYHREVERVEEEIRAANRHIAVLAGNYLETLLRQLRQEALIAERLASPTLPPPPIGADWELVADDGIVVLTQVDPTRIDRPCGYSDLLNDDALDPRLTAVGNWIDGEPPTVLFCGSRTAAGHLVAVLDPVVLHGQLQAWTTEGVDRHLYVVDGGGRLLFYSDLELSTSGADLRANPPIRLFVEGGDSDLRYTSTVSGKERIGTVHRLVEGGWGVIVSADVGARLIDLRSRYWWLAWSIVFAFAAAMAILVVSSRRLVRPVLDIVRSLRDPERTPQTPLVVQPSTRRVAEYDELVQTFDDLVADFAAVERELVQAEKASLLGQLASGLAHEMGTPLNVITGNAQYLLRKAPADDPTRSALQLIVKQAQRIAAMIRRLLDVSRPAEARLVPVDIPLVVRQILEIVPGLINSVKVRCDLDALAPSALADPKLLEHALMNLIANACQAMPDGGRLTLVTGVESADGAGDDPSVVVIVADTGCGIPAEVLPRIFEPFFTTKAPSQGTGLGLAIVERIVRLHGGRVEVASTAGRGTVVTLFLRPAASVDPAVRGSSEEGK